MICFYIILILLIPILVFFSPLKAGIPVANRMFVLILFESILLLFFLKTMFSGQNNVEKENILKKLFFYQFKKYAFIFTSTFVLGMFFLERNSKAGAIIILIPLFGVWIYELFKRKSLSHIPIKEEEIQKNSSLREAVFIFVTHNSYFFFSSVITSSALGSIILFLLTFVLPNCGIYLYAIAVFSLFVTLMFLYLLRIKLKDENTKQR